MQTSNICGKDLIRDRVVLCVKRALVAIAAIALVNVVGIAIIEPYASMSGVAWEDYRADRTVDTLIVGSSYSELGINPSCLDAELGSNSINLSSAGQSAFDTYLVTKKVLGQSDVKRVVYGIGTQTVTNPPSNKTAVPLMRYMDAGDSTAYVDDALTLLANRSIETGADSLLIATPWAYNLPTDADALKQSIAARASGKSRVAATEEAVPGWHYVGKGYGSYAIQLNPTKEDKTTANVYHPQGLDESEIYWIGKMCQLCHDSGVNLYIIVTPHPAYDVLSLGRNYVNFLSPVEQIAEQSGAIFLDTNMLREGQLEFQQSDYYNFEHLNIIGADKFSSFLGNRIRGIELGEDVSGGFYSYDDFDEYVASHTELAGLVATTAQDSSGVTLTAQPYGGYGHSIEYQLLAPTDDAGQFSVVRDWAPDSTMHWQPPSNGTYKLLVRARVTDSDAEYDKELYKTINYMQ